MERVARLSGEKMRVESVSQDGGDFRDERFLALALLAVLIEPYSLLTHPIRERNLA